MQRKHAAGVESSSAPPGKLHPIVPQASLPKKPRPPGLSLKIFLPSPMSVLQAPINIVWGRWPSDIYWVYLDRFFRNSEEQPWVGRVGHFRSGGQNPWKVSGSKQIWRRCSSWVFLFPTSLWAMVSFEIQQGPVGEGDER